MTLSACVGSVPVRTKCFVRIMAARKLGREQKIDESGSVGASLAHPITPDSVDVLLSPHFARDQTLLGQPLLRSSCYSG